MSQSPRASRLSNLGLVLLDLVFLFATFNCAYFFRIGEWHEQFFLTWEFFLVASSVGLMGYIFDLYNLQSTPNLRKLPGRFFVASLITAVVVAFAVYLLRVDIRDLFGRGILLGSIVSYGLIGASLRWILANSLQRRLAKQNWLVLLNSEFVKPFWRDCNLSHFNVNLNILVDRPEALTDVKNYHVVGPWNDLNQFINSNWDGIVVGSNENLNDDLTKQLLQARLKGTRVYNIIDFYEFAWFKMPVFFLNHSWLTLTQGFGLIHNKFGLRFKRICDILGALLLLPIAILLVVLVLPFMLISDGFPILFRQTRTGLNNENFTILKLRSMIKEAEANGAQWAQKNDNRITSIGKFLRKSRIDELPQLINVLKGDMSFIGPRPERPEFNEKLEREIPHYSLRHVIAPGITGWAQTQYRYGSSVEDSLEKLQYDLFYIKNYNLFLDFRIIFKTIKTVLFGAGR